METRVERRRAAWRPVALAGVALLVVAGFIAATVLLVNQGPLPGKWRAAVASELSQGLGAEVTIEAARLAGPGRIVLEGVRAQGDVTFYLPRVIAGFSLWNLEQLVQKPWEALRWIQVSDFELTLSAAGLAEWAGWPGVGAPADSDTGTSVNQAAEAGQREEPAKAVPWESLSVELINGRITVDSGQGSLSAAVNGRLALDGEHLVLHGLRTELAGFAATWRGSLWPGPDVHARIEASDVSALTEALPSPWRAMLPVMLSGKTEGDVWVAGTWAAPRAWGRLWLDGLTVGPGEVAQRPYHLTGGTLAWSYWPARGLELSLDAARAGTRLWVEGTVATGGILNLSVTATDVELPADVAALDRWGVAGQADFIGHLVGTVHRPVLAGELLSDGGRLLDQPFSSLAGQVRLSRDEFSVSRARIAQGLSEYHLEGRVSWARGPGEPGQLDLVLRTDRGRVEALTGALGWDVPVQAGFSGTLVFDGPFGAVQGQGGVVLTEGIAWGQPFDRMAGEFHYGPEGFRIPDATGSVRGGTVHVRGGGMPAGPWDLEVTVEDVPVQAVAALRDRLPALSGLLGFTGTVRRAAGEPIPGFEGQMTARHLRVGTLDFTEAYGAVEWDGDALRTGGLTLRRPSGGTYVAAGAVHDASGDPQLDLEVTVHGESLGDVLAVTGLRLPLLAPSGRVAAYVDLQGTPTRPEARIRLDAPDVQVIGYRTGVAVEITVRDGRIEVEELSRAG